MSLQVKQDETDDGPYTLYFSSEKKQEKLKKLILWERNAYDISF